MTTFLQIQNRFLTFVDESTITDTHKSHINASVQDACNAYNFDFNTIPDTLTISSGAANLASDFNYTWGIDEGNATYNGSPLTRIPLTEIWKYSDGDLVYWITWDNSNKVYVFNSKVSDGDVDIVYHFIPSDMSADGDVCLISDGEAIALKAASKHFLGEGEEAKVYEPFDKQADDKLKKLYANTLNFGPQVYETSKMNQSSFTRRGI